ncbi:MAG: hypothetical protein JWM93_73 [Frankiales bacterium]|nr:hypothetical protein [Frankiales bacterium]
MAVVRARSIGAVVGIALVLGASPTVVALAATGSASGATAAAATSAESRTARIRIAGTVYRATVPRGDVGLAAPTVFTTLADKVAARFTVAARPATVTLLDAEPVFIAGTPGRRVTAARVLAALRHSLASHRAVDVPVTFIPPPRPGPDTESVIVVHAGENKLYLYEHHFLTRTFPVATGSPDFPTPKGTFSIQLMRDRPTWVNPHPTTGWGLTMPAVIPPGPGNPLGLRAMNLTAPNIRIHGTPQDNSIGYSVSHGCVRMHNSDVVQLFSLVGTGTTVFIAQTRPPKLPPAGSGIATAVDTADGA